MANYLGLLSTAEITVSDEPTHIGEPRPLMHTHTVTLYNSLGEVDRKATFQRTVLRGVRVERKSGAVATMNGQLSTDGLMVYIPPMTLYVEPEGYDGEGWTLRPGDLLTVDESTTEIPTGTVAQVEAVREVFRITGVQRCDFTSGLHHFEVAAA